MWEYKTVVIAGALVGAKNTAAKIDEALNAMGGDGWELVNIYGYGVATCIAIFKRHSKNVSF